MPKEAIIQSSLEAVEIIESPIPTPKDKEIVIKVKVAGTNPKDWKYPVWKSYPHNSGDDMAGIVHSVGKDVFEFSPGDRVAAYHVTGGEHGTFAEYSVAPDWTTFHIPANVSFEEAATLPVCALTAAVALYADLKFPTPYATPLADGKRIPIVIYGVTTAVGAFAAKLARLSGLKPIIGIAGRASEYASTLVDHVIDYRNGEDAIVAGVEAALTKEGFGRKAPYILDAISEGGTIETNIRFLDPKGVMSTVLPTNLFALDKENFKYPDGVTSYNSAVPEVHSTKKDFGYVWSRYIGRLLQEGKLEAHPYEVIPGGLNGVLTGLQKLRDGKASAVKYVYRIEETGEVQAGGGGGLVQESGQRGAHALKNFPFPKNN